LEPLMASSVSDTGGFGVVRPVVDEPVFSIEDEDTEKAHPGIGLGIACAFIVTEGAGFES